MAMLALLVLAVSIWASPPGLPSANGAGSLNNSGPHGLSEILYAYSSANATTAALRGLKHQHALA